MDPLAILQGYQVEHGRIVDPGRYRGEPAYTPYFHRMWMEQLADQQDCDSGVFWLHEGDWQLFPDLVGSTQVILFTDESGHVTAYAQDHTERPD